MKTLRTILSVVLLAIPAQTVFGQLANDDAPIVVGHYHLNVTSVEAHLDFWVDTLGGEATTFEGEPAVWIPDVFIVLHQQAPTGPTLGTTFDHVGLAVPDVPAATERVVTAGYGLTVGREPAPGETASPPTAGNYGRFSYLIGPDGVKVELVTAENPDADPITHHHVHFVNREFVEMQQWYINALNATHRDVETDFFRGADLPGVGYMLNFFSWLPEQELTGTAGRVLDHVGFEVRDLETFCQQLPGRGVELAEPCHREGSLTVARIIDPWGTVIELTEGLREN